MRSTITGERCGSISRAPASVAISARTPFDAPLRLTVSMNGPGNVFSRPMRRPTIFSVSDVVIDHLLPVRPVMRPTIPQMQLGGHALLLQHAREPLRFVDVRVVAPGRDDDLRLPERPQISIVVEIRKEREWIHEVRLAAPLAVQPACRVVRAGHADGLPRYARTPGDERERMKRAERSSGHDQLVLRVGVADRRQDLVDEVSLVREVAASAFLRCGRLVVPGLAVDRIDAPELEPTRIDPRCHVRHDAEVLPLVEPAHGGWKDEDRGAAVAEDEHLHIAPQGRAPPLPVLTVHDVLRARARASPISFHATSASCQPFTSADLLLSSSL